MSGEKREHVRIGDIPYCRIHGLKMYVGSSPPGIRYYYCPEKDCRESAQRVRRDKR